MQCSLWMRGPQRLTGFSRWQSYNWMGKTVLGLFLVITHFIIL